MMRFLRSQSQLVLIIFLGVMGLGFLFYGNAGNLLTSTGGHVSNDFGSIEGQDLSVAELYSAIRNTRYALILNGHGRELNQPGGQQQLAQEAWRQLLLLHEADKLHIQISDQELIDYIHKQTIFQKDGAYSPEVYQSQMQQLQLALRIPSDQGPDPLVTTKDTFLTVIRNGLRTGAVYRALFGTVHSSAQDISAQYEKAYGPTVASIITFNPKSFEGSVQVSPDDIAAEYKDHPMNPEYRTKEKRKIDYVLLTLTPEQAKLPAAEKKAAIDALGEKALDFVLAFQPEPTAGSSTPPPAPDFVAEAKKRGLNPASTDFFSEDATPANVPPSPSFNSGAFSLAKDNAISKVIELDNGVAVLHLVEIQPSDLLPLEQVKDGIVKALREAKAIQAAEDAAQKAGDQLKAAIAKGTDFKAAAAGLNLKVETLPSFVPMKVAPNDQRLQVVAYVATTLATGQISGPVPDQGNRSTLLVHLDSRATADPAGLADFEKTFRARQDDRLQSFVYIDWADWASKRPGTHPPPQLEAYGSVE